MHLRDHLHWCNCQGRVILLDLEADRYFCLPSGLEAPFLRAVGGTSLAPDRHKLRTLFDRGLLLETESGDRAGRGCEPIPTPDDDMFAVQPRRAAAADIGRAIALDLWARRQLRRKPLLIVAQQVALRADGLRPRTKGQEDQLARIASAFSAIGLVLRAADRCLVRALAVHAACCRAGIRADFVIGVHLHPFQAHAWVQVDRKVLVGDYEQVRLFTPIAALR
jgi:hypothetical protein